MLDEKELTIGVSGMLRKNALVMYDRETETLWSHYTGEGLAGPNKGKKLTVLASSPRVTWAAWLDAYPWTKVLTVNGNFHARSPYESYFDDPERMGVRPVGNLDERMPGKDLVVGVVSNNMSTAVPLDLLNEKGIVTTQLDGKQIAIFADVDLGLFGAVVVPDGVTFTKTEMRSLISSDGREWSAIDGKGSGDDLEMLPAIRSFWFAWGDHYPKTGLVTK